MALLDTINDGLRKIIPVKQQKSTPLSGGIGNGGHGVVEDDMIVPKAIIVFHASQIFFNFLAMACFAGVAAFQAKWHVGPSGLTGFTVFITVAGMFYSAFMLVIPVVYERYDKFMRLARALKEARVGFILTGTGATVSLMIAFIDTISAWTEPGCKDPSKDPHADLGDDFKAGLPGWCSTKRAGAIFLWLAFIFWGASLGYLIYEWRQGKLHAPRDPPFQRPQSRFDDGREDDEEEGYHVIPPVRQPNISDSSYTQPQPPNPFADSNRYDNGPSSPTNIPAPAPYQPVSRPSMDAYGAFSDPAPSGFGNTTPRSGAGFGGGGPPIIPEPDLGPKVSRTMQYADPYAAVRAQLNSGQPQPPGYESYQGYR